MTETKLTLMYFPIPGKAEAIRLTAAVGKIPFTNQAISFPEFVQSKSSYPLGQLPLLRIDTMNDNDDSSIEKTLTMTQSDAILRYIGKLSNLYPSDDQILAMKIDEMLCVMEDLTSTITLTIQGPQKACLSDEGVWSNDEKIAIRKRWMNMKVPQYIGYIERTLQSSKSGWLVGDNLTIADIKFYTQASHITSGILDGVPPTVLDEYPNCLALMKKVKQVDGIQAWYEKYSTPYDTFDYE